MATNAGAAGWLPMDVDEWLAAEQLMLNAHASGDVPGFFDAVVSAERAKSGKKGALSGAVELPDAFAATLLEVKHNPPKTQQAIMRAIRQGLDAAMPTASGPGMPAFRDWYHGNNRNHNVKLAAMLARSMPGFASWLETFPPK